MNIKITINHNEKQYNYEFKDKSIYTITEEFKRILKDLEKLNQWNKSNAKVKQNKSQDNSKNIV